MTKDIDLLLIESAKRVDNCLYSLKYLLNWIKQENTGRVVKIKPTSLRNSTYWFYDSEKGYITNKNGSFFTIKGIQEITNQKVTVEQPIIVQNEIGYLGIIMKVINGVLYCLMQAKIEPGNINKVQISPTIQATKSNFTQKHGGKKPPYLNIFLNIKTEQIIYDQIQSEQSSRFYKKRNRNICVITDENIDILPHFIWMTIGQIKALMKYDNLVNMDTRTIISCLPFHKTKTESVSARFQNNRILKSYLSIDNKKIIEIYSFLANKKMLSDTAVNFKPLKTLSGWNFNDNEIVSKNPYPFKCIFCKIEIEDREVRSWSQPLFMAEGKALFGLFIREIQGIVEILIKGKHEIGCFDYIELGPTVQKEYFTNEPNNEIDERFYAKMNKSENIIIDTVLSEEGGRFYHEQNRNIIIEISDDFEIPYGYFWVSLGTVSTLMEHNNLVNIQLRNLISLLEI